MLGIANFLGERMGDKFLAGIWEGQFARDLLWRSDGNPYEQFLPKIIQKIYLPS
jgi:hypothetical protein